MLKSLLIVFLLLLIQLSSSQKCTKEEMKNIKSCQSAIIGLSEKMKITKAGIPSTETLNDLTSECKKTIDCVGESKCSIFVDNVVKPCEAINLVKEVVPCFLNVSATISKSPEKYPCLKENNIDVNSQTSLCNLMKNAKPCFELVTKQICGEKVQTDKIYQLVNPYLKCA